MIPLLQAAEIAPFEGLPYKEKFLDVQSPHINVLHQHLRAAYSLLHDRDP